MIAHQKYIRNKTTTTTPTTGRVFIVIDKSMSAVTAFNVLFFQYIYRKLLDCTKTDSLL